MTDEHNNDDDIRNVTNTITTKRYDMKSPPTDFMNTADWHRTLHDMIAHIENINANQG